MKTWVRYISVLGFLILYGLEISFYVQPRNSQESDASLLNESSVIRDNANHRTSDIYSDSSSNVVNIAPQSYVGFSIFLNKIQNFTQFAILSEQVKFFTFLQFEDFSLLLMRSFQKTDIIFPFHSFW
jgi:hypothetical protein